MSGGFVHLGARSDWSVGESLARVEELSRLAAADEQCVLAIADRMSLASAPVVQQQARRLGLRAIYGLEARVLPFGQSRWMGRSYTVRLLAATIRGWRRLVTLVNRGAEHAGPGQIPHLTWEEILAEPDGLLLLAGGENGELAEAACARRFEEIESLMDAALSSFGSERMFVALPAPGSSKPCRVLAALAEHYGLAAVAVPEVRYARAEDDLAWRVWNAESREGFAPGTRVGDLKRPIEDCRHFLTVQEVRRLYADFPNAVENAGRVASLCEAEPPMASKKFPPQEFERGVDAESYIWNEVFARASQRYGDLPARWRERLNREFRDLVEADLADALMCLARLDEALRDRGLARGPGAGFLTNSLAASLLGVTRLDPLRFDLPFSLPEGRGTSSPRLDLILPSTQMDRAEEALNEVFEGHICPAGRWQHWTQVPVLDKVLRQAGWQGKPASRLARTDRWKRAAEKAFHAPEGQSLDPSLTLQDLPALAWIVSRTEGRVRRPRAKPGEYVFTAGPARRELPRVVTAEGVMASEWDTRCLERMGHGRLAFSREPMIDVIDTACALVRDQGRKPPELTANPPEDPETFQLLREGRTQGIRSFEGPSVRRRLRQTQPSDLKSLLRALTGRGARESEEPVVTDSETVESILVALWCATLKAHEPVAFSAAALTQAAGHPGQLLPLLDEVRRNAIPLKPLDVNCSTSRWAPEGRALRPGLLCVRGLSQEACNEIEYARRDLAFGDLADLLKRTDPRHLKVEQIETLIRAGALDSLGPPRGELLDNLPRLAQLLRPRKPSAAEDDPLQFFGRGSDWWLENQVLESEWLRRDKEDSADWEAEQQRAATGLVIGSSLLDVFAEFRRAARLYSPGKLGTRDRGKDRTLAGPVDAIEPCNRGETAGCILEMAGCQVRVAGMFAAAAREIARDGTEVLVSGRIDRDAFQWTMEADVLIGLDDAIARWRAAKVLELHLERVGLREAKELYGLLKVYPGATEVRVVSGVEGRGRLETKIASRKVGICPGLELGLARILPAGSWRIEVPEAAVRSARDSTPVALWA